MSALEIEYFNRASGYLYWSARHRGALKELKDTDDDYGILDLGLQR